MPLRPERGVAIRTARDDARRAHLDALHEQWAAIDAHMDEALQDTLPPTDK